MHFCDLANILAMQIQVKNKFIGFDEYLIMIDIDQIINSETESDDEISVCKSNLCLQSTTTTNIRINKCQWKRAGPISKGS